jgi:hypothetical protein
MGAPRVRVVTPAETLPRRTMPRRVAVLATGLLLSLPASLTVGCGFLRASLPPNVRDRHPPYVPLRQEAATSHVVLLVRLAKAKATLGHSNHFVIERVLKGGPKFVPGGVFRIDPLGPNPPSRLLVFCELTRGKPEPIRSVEATPALVNYLHGLLGVDPRDRLATMRYCFGYLGHADRAVAVDAFVEFYNSPDRDIRTFARRLRPGKLRRWIQDKRMESWKVGLFARLLGYCGDTTDAALLRRYLDGQMKEGGYLRDEALTAYTLLRPREGWAYARRVLGDPATEFPARYAALRSLHCLHTTHPGVVPDREALQAVVGLLRQNDIADLAIESLRKWRCWKFTYQILPLFKAKGYEDGVIRRSIVRYALQCPQEAARWFVAAARNADPETVADAEEGLRLEATPGANQAGAP